LLLTNPARRLRDRLDNAISKVYALP
jgi:hypothetical protein